MNENAIEMCGLEKHFKDFSLGPLDFTIPTGCIVGYIGENGAGKSTTIKLILGLLRPDTGHIKVLGQEVGHGKQELMNKIGVVFDDLHLPGEMKIKEVGKFSEMSFATWQEETFSNLLNHFDLPVQQRIKNLSRGMKMKLSLGIALSHQAELLILDEATSGLDPVVRDEILDLLLDFLQDEGHTVFISSHILSDLEKAADYIALIHEGKLLFMEQKDELREQYALCSLSKEMAERLDHKAIIGRREHAFGEDLLVKRDLVPSGIELSKPTIEDIMVYIIKGDTHEGIAL